MKKVTILIMLALMIIGVLNADMSAAPSQDNTAPVELDWAVKKEQIKQVYVSQGFTVQKAQEAVNLLENLLVELGVLKLQFVKEPPTWINPKERVK